jgi:hypothetical protein
VYPIIAPTRRVYNYEQRVNVSVCQGHLIWLLLIRAHFQVVVGLVAGYGPISGPTSQNVNTMELHVPNWPRFGVISNLSSEDA